MITDKSREVRKYLYAVLVAVGPLVTFYGVASADEVALWLGVGGTLLGIPAGTTALANLAPKVTSPEVVVVDANAGTPLQGPLAAALEETDDDDEDAGEVEDPFEMDELPSRRSLREE